MVFAHAQDILAQQLQEERLAKLCDDNAFVNVAEVLKRQRRDGASVNAVDIEVNFLEPSAASSSAPPRVHLSRCLMDQHRAYIRALEDDRRDHKREDGASVSGSSSSSSSSSEDVAMDTATNRAKRARHYERHSGETRKRGQGGSHDGSSNANKLAANTVQTARDVGQECRDLGAWLQSRRPAPLELTMPGPSYMAMAAPPPLHSGGYHLCSFTMALFLPSGVCVFAAAASEEETKTKSRKKKARSGRRTKERKKMLGIGQLSGSALFSRGFDSTIVREDLLSQNQPRQLSALQQVVAFMTIGRDMSGHFSDIAPLCSSTNLTIKRLVYLYLMHNSHTQPQKAVLQAGVFVKDTFNDSPLIRGAALRTMTSLLVPVMVDFITAPLQRCLEDSDPYVRRIAAFGTLKLFYMAPNVCEEVGLLDKLQKQLNDENACVVASAVAAILELRQRHAPIALEEAIAKNVSRVLGAASEATGWYQHYLIEGVAVAFKNNALLWDMEKAEMIVDGVLPFLSSFNVATVMSAVKAVTSFLLQASALLTPSALETDDYNRDVRVFQLRDRYGPRLVGACVSLLYESCVEVRYAAFRNIRLLLKTGLRPFFKHHLSLFFVKYEDPIYIKLEKAELLLELADTEVGEVILSEFAAYATDADEELVRKAVRLIGFLAAKVGPLAQQCVEKLFGLIDTGISHVVQDTAVVVQTILRRYPNRFLNVVSKLCEVLDELKSAESKAAVVWVLGDYAEHVENAGRILEMCAESFLTQPQIVQFALLTAAVKNYLSSSAKGMGRSANFLQRVLTMATQSPRPDVRDRAFMYWRLIRTDCEAAKKLVLTSSKGASFSMADTMEKRRLQGFLMEFGSLAAVLHRPLHLIYDKEAFLNENDEEEEGTGDNVRGTLARCAVSDGDTAGTTVNNVVSRGLITRDKEAMQVALSADEGNGLEVRMGWSHLGNKLLLNCHFSLVPGEGYTRHAVVLALQINRNIHALGLAQECPVVELEVGKNEPETVQLMTGTNNEKSPMRDLLVAVNADPIGTRYFLAPPVPPAMLLLPAASIDSGLFAQQFRQLQAPSWTMPTMLTPPRTDQTRYTANALRLHGLNLVYTGKPHGSGIVRLLISAETIAAQKLFMEATIQGDLVVYLGVRCKDTRVSPVFGAYTLRVLSAAETQ